MEGQIKGYFPDYILDPSVIDCIGQASVQCDETSQNLVKPKANSSVWKHEEIP